MQLLVKIWLILTKKVKMSIYKFKKWVYIKAVMKKTVVILVLFLIAISAAYCDDGDYITVVCEVKEIKPTFSINTDTFENGTFIYVTQDNMARYYGSYVVDVKLNAIHGDYIIDNLQMVDDCHSTEISTGLKLCVDYDGRTIHPRTIASWTMTATTPDLYGTVTLSFKAL